MLKQSITICLTALGVACTTLPRAELQAYRDAFQAAETAAVPMIEAYAVNERAQAITALKGDRNWNERRYFRKFEPVDALDAATIGLPPGAEAMTRAFRSIANYNDALVALAENRNIDEARAQIRQIATDLGTLPGLQSATEPVNQAANILFEVFRPALGELNRRELRDLVLRGYDPTLRLIDALRRHTPIQYETTIEALEARWGRERDQAAQQQIAREIDGWHSVFANYTALLNVMERRLTDLHDAVENPRQAPVLSQASAYATDVRVYAEGLRRSLAELRAPH